MQASPVSDHAPDHSGDAWASWVLQRRFGGDAASLQQTLRFLGPIRERLLAGAAIQPGQRILDVASRDGYIGFAALDRAAPDGRVTFTEASSALLDVCREFAAANDLSERCEFVLTPPDDLSPFEDGSFDVVTVRSILGYVEDRVATMREWRRVLRPGGRLSLIQMFIPAEPEDRLAGYDVTPVQDLAAKLRAVLERARPRTFSADFDERLLVEDAERAGFTKLTLDFELEINPNPDWPPRDWEVATRMAGTPGGPTLAEAMGEALTREEAARFEGYLRPLVERGERLVRFPKAYLHAVR